MTCRWQVQGVEYTYLIDVDFVPKGEDIAQHLSKTSMYGSFARPLKQCVLETELTCLPGFRFEIDLIGSGSLRSLRQGDILQLNRKGFFICDQAGSLKPRVGLTGI